MLLSERFKLSVPGLILWILQLQIAVYYNYDNWHRLKKNPCNNELSCAIFVQNVINSFTILLQLLLIGIKYKSIRNCFNNVASLLAFQDLPINTKRRTILFFNILFKTATISRCIFTYSVKKLQVNAVLPFLAMLVQIDLENTAITLLFVATACFGTISQRLEILQGPRTRNKQCGIKNAIRKIQVYFDKITELCSAIQNAYCALISVSIFSVLAQLLLIAYFETTLNIKPIKRNLLINLYLTANIVFVIIDVMRMTFVCYSSNSTNTQVRKTHSILFYEATNNNYILRLQHDH